MWKCPAFICKAFSLNRLRNVHTFCSRAAILDAAVKPIGENSLETYLHVLCLDSHIFHCTKEKNSKRQRKRWPPPCKNHVCTKPIFAVPAVCQRLDGQGSPTKMADRLFRSAQHLFQGEKKAKSSNKNKRTFTHFLLAVARLQMEEITSLAFCSVKKSRRVLC